MTIRFHQKFVKSYRKCPFTIQQKVDERLGLFSKDPSAEELNNHGLKGPFKGYRSINITGDYRAHFKKISEHEVIFVRLGTHSQLYG